MMRMPAPNRRAFEGLEVFHTYPRKVVQAELRGFVWPAQSGKGLAFPHLKQQFKGIILREELAASRETLI